MDYFQDSYNKWSTCSVEDFQSYYDQQGSNFCLKATDATETTTTTTTTVTTSTTTSGTKITTLKPAEKKCIEAGGSRCVQNCKKFNFSPSSFCRAFIPTRTDCSCSLFGTPTTTTTPKITTLSAAQILCKKSPGACLNNCKRFNYSSSSVCRIPGAICICSWLKP